MAKVIVKLTLKDGEGCQIVVRIGDETFDFQKGGTKTVELESRRYTALIAGFLDPSSENPSAKIEFKQEGEILNTLNITERKFIKTPRVTVN